MTGVFESMQIQIQNENQAHLVIFNNPISYNFKF